MNIGNQVIFQGFNSNIPLVGRLNLTQRGYETAMRAMGAIGVSQKVKIEAYGQSLDLNRAIARFNGPLSNPTLDIDANKMFREVWLVCVLQVLRHHQVFKFTMMLVCLNKKP